MVMLRLFNSTSQEARAYDSGAVPLRIGVGPVTVREFASTPSGREALRYDSRPPLCGVGDTSLSRLSRPGPQAFTADDLKLLLEYFPTRE
jgi:hypothetical protein